MTLADLRSRRVALAATRRAAAALADAGVAVPEQMTEQIEELAASWVWVTVPCLVCKTPHPLRYQVGEDPPGWPYGVLCRACDDEVIAEAARLRAWEGQPDDRGAEET